MSARSLSASSRRIVSGRSEKNAPERSVSAAVASSGISGYGSKPNGRLGSRKNTSGSKKEFRQRKQDERDLRVKVELEERTH